MASSCAVYGISIDVPTFGDSGADVPSSCTGDIYFQVDVNACSCDGSKSYAVCIDSTYYACSCSIPSGYSPACPPNYTAACASEDGSTEATVDAGLEAAGDAETEAGIDAASDAEAGQADSSIVDAHDG
jgi:hypothetical protein